MQLQPDGWRPLAVVVRKTRFWDGFRELMFVKALPQQASVRVRSSHIPYPGSPSVRSYKRRHGYKPKTREG